MYICIYVYICVCVYFMAIHTDLYIHMHIDICHIDICTYVSEHIYIYIHTRLQDLLTTLNPLVV